MSSPEDLAEALLEQVLAAPHKGKRKLVALAGAPASGKTTLAKVLAERLTKSGCAASVVPMDGFHLDNRILAKLGLIDRKGAPDTFDVEGMLSLLKALPDADRVFYPTFDRDEDFSRAGSGMIDEECACVVLEGNYLLFDAPLWREMASLWDVSIRLNVPLDVLHQRLVQRWLDFGLSLDNARKRAEGNDMLNARLIADYALSASITI